MTQILVRVDEDLAREVKRLVKDKYGGRRGALSLIVEDALRGVLSPPAAISSSTLLEVIDYVERAAKEGQPKDQILTNVYIMLDREFEQTIIRGVGDMKGGRVHKVPPPRIQSLSSEDSPIGHEICQGRLDTPTSSWLASENFREDSSCLSRARYEK